jgi:hypothetical protein
MGGRRVAGVVGGHPPLRQAAQLGLAVRLYRPPRPAARSWMLDIRLIPALAAKCSDVMAFLRFWFLADLYFVQAQACIWRSPLAYSPYNRLRAASSLWTGKAHSKHLNWNWRPQLTPTTCV